VFVVVQCLIKFFQDPGEDLTTLYVEGGFHHLALQAKAKFIFVVTH